MNSLAEHIGLGLPLQFVFGLDAVAAVILVEVGLVKEAKFAAWLVVGHLAPHHQFVEVAARDTELGSRFRRRK